MKKYVSIFAMAAVAAAALVSCSKEIDKQDVIDNGVKMKTITVKTAIAETKTSLDANHENIVWSEGDKISIFNDVNNTNLQKPYAEGADIIIEVPEATNEIYAHYPYYDKNESGPGSVSVYISNAQTQENPGELNGYYYPMVAKGTVSADNKALISLYPVASALALNLYHTSLSGEEKVKSVTVTPSSTNSGFIGRQTTNITVDDVKYTQAELSNPVKVTLTNFYALGNSKPSNKQTFAGQIYVCLAKQSYSDVKFEIETDKGIYTITSKNAAFDLENNDFVPVNINLEKASFVSFDTAVDPTAYSWTLVKNALTVGDKVVIAAAGSNNVAMSTTQNSNNRGKVNITKNGNAMTAFEGVQVFEVVAGSVTNPTTFAFKCLNGEQIGKYIAAASSSSNYLRSVSDIDDNASWSVSIDADNGVASVVAQGSFERNTLQYNSATNSTLFACYGSASQSAVVFYRVSLPSAELSFPKSSYSVNLGETFTKPTLTNPHDVSVSYASTNENVATVDESTGDITIKAEGSTTITASFAGNSTYSATEASYELTVVDPNKVYYVKVTETPSNDDWSGIYLIVAEGASKILIPEFNGTSGGKATDVTISDSKIESTPAISAYAWIIEKEGNNSYTVKNGNLYLGWESGNAARSYSVSTSNNAKNIFAISSGAATIKNSADNSRILRYNSQVTDANGPFRYYTGATGAVAVLYKLNDGKTDAGVSVNYSGSITYAPNDATVQLVVTNPNSVNLSFTSSNESVATVDNSGIVTIKGAGEATITASWEDKKVGEITYRGGSCEYNLSVAKATPVIAAFADSDVEVAVGSSITKTTTIDPSSLSIEYKTSDNTVASIDASTGAVTGLKNGTVTISATFAGNDNYNAAETKTYSLKVGTGESSGMTAVPHQTITFSSLGYSNQQEVSSVNGTNCTLSFAKGSNSNVPKYFTTGSALRLYGGNSMTISVDAKYKITSIKLTFASGEGSNEITTNVGSYSDGTWSGSIEDGGSVTFTIGGTSGHRRIASVEIN